MTILSKSVIILCLSKQVSSFTRQKITPFQNRIKTSYYTLFFYKNKLYKNTQAEICPEIKNNLRTIARLKFWSEKFKKFI